MRHGGSEVIRSLLAPWRYAIGKRVGKHVLANNYFRWRWGILMASEGEHLATFYLGGGER